MDRYGTTEPIVIYTHIAKRLNESNPVIRVKPMRTDEGYTHEYHAQENARNVAKLFMMSLPGSTVDELFKVIANEIRPMLESSDNIECLKRPYDLENRIRCALDILANQE